MAIGGSIESISIKSRNFPVAADADSNRQLGGFTNEVAANGDGGARQIKTRTPWKLDGIQLEIDNVREDLEFLQGVSDAQDWVPVLVNYVDGTSYQGRGTIQGEVVAASQSATSTLEFCGPDKLTKQ
jgi:hypothetical protein